MEILVCVKQVPDTAEVKIDPVKNTIIRAGVPNIFNPFDQNALEGALQLKDADKDNVKVTLLSMGPEQAKDVLREGLAMGADDAYLVSDRKLGGSDTLATGYALAQAVKKVAELKGIENLIWFFAANRLSMAIPLRLARRSLANSAFRRSRTLATSKSKATKSLSSRKMKKVTS